MKKTLLVLLGLPRSGTTMATAVFDVHPDIIAWFEPWNVSPDHSLQPLKSIDDYLEKHNEIFNMDLSDRNVFMIKETTAHKAATAWTKESIENIIKNDDVNVKVIWLVRDINHAYLSRVHTAREHWGHPDMKIDTDSFRKYINFAYTGFQDIETLVSQYDACLLSYEKLVSDTESTLIDIMNFIGMELHPNQLEYHKHFKKHKSAGDPEVTNNPQPVSPEKIIKKDQEWLHYKEIFLESLNDKGLEKYNAMNKIVNEIRNKGFQKIN